MCIRNRVISLIYRIFLFAVCGVGLYFYSGIPQGNPSVDMFKYFSVLTCALLFLYLLADIVKLLLDMRKKGVTGSSTYSSVLKGAVLMCSLVNLLVYYILLAGSGFAVSANPDALASLVIHLVVPLLVLADWALFDRKGQLKGGDPFYWLLLPGLYYLFVFLAAQTELTYWNGSIYPYYFIDSTLLGWRTVIINLVVFAVAFVALGYVYFGIDKFLGSIVKRKQREEKVEADKMVYMAGTSQNMAGPSGMNSFPELQNLTAQQQPNMAPRQEPPPGISPHADMEPPQ